jgi:hypothetical protein
MYELRASFGASPRAVNKPANVVASAWTPVLITEQQVLFGTAAAMPLQPAKPARRWALAARSIGAGLGATFATFSNEVEPKRRHYPSRDDFLEDSRMAREMVRL